MRATTSFERNLTGLIAQHGISGLRDRSGATEPARSGALVIRLHKDPEEIGRELAVAVYRRIWP